MKRLGKISFAVAFAFLGFNMTPALADLQPAYSVNTVWEDEKGKEIQFTELPQAVQDAFNQSDYAQWRVDKVYKMQKDNQTWFKLSVTDGGQNKDIKYDANGQLMKEKKQG